PEAREQLQTQRELSPENWQLWQNAEPPAPLEETWATVRQSIEDETREPVAPETESAGRWKRVVLWVAGGGAGAAAVMIAWWAAAAVMLGWGAPLPPNPPAPQPEPGRSQPEVAQLGHGGAPVPEVEALPMASDEDVELLRVSGGDVAWLVVGVHPLPDVLVLA